jgi:uncharacterized cupredoxin-like copper-binding protein
MQRFGFLVIALVTFGVLTAAGCSSDSTGSAGPPANRPTEPALRPPDGTQAVTLTVDNSMSFEPSTINLHAGEPVQLNLKNNGQMPHDFTLTEGVSEPVKITATGGKTASVTFTVTTPGTYSFDCSMPGHAAAGMRGTITVQ